MNKKELVAVVAQKAGVSKKDAEAVVNALVESVTAELKKGGKVQLVGFGTFEVSKRTARVGRNPRTNETIKIKASKAPKFKAGKALKDAVNKKK
ncbi:MAG: HU family DNA-binding protein [Lachnospiraceae bacterium]|nr:HU family DNA-binding protein [Lachnospiraceae bacterium]